ncbi:hypothetical protein DA099_08760 [Photobacterium damselae]|uniref:Uncharacterized protein n=1 Tax=Photobacterium damselae TaxID=38293 RepID=A0ACD3T1W4_PHODM|nr:hypothetical protein BC461_08965 [Photobacterium damselae]TMX50582.1 hypothetical protein DA099_08760 [Photobacterium damselae]TMX66645.1 hypothetical protein DA090_07975 [Photobacterium damselae]TMX74955.1 hypothetical protein DA092_11015 [Photobacterium damselae]
MNAIFDIRKIRIRRNIKKVRLELDLAMDKYRLAITQGDENKIKTANDNVIKIRDYYELLMKELDSI